MRFLILARLALLSLALSSWWAMPTAARSTVSEDLHLKLRSRVQDYSLTGANFVEALTRVASKFQIPMGIAWANTPAARTQVTLSWKEATVQEVIEAVAGTQPGYEVEVANGVVHVYARNRVADRENFLTLNIKAFDVHCVPVELAAHQLRDSVKLRVSPPKPRSDRGGIAGSGAANADDPRITVRMNNASVEEILDKIAVLSPRKIWIVTFSDDRQLTPTGFRRTLSLWDPSPVSDDEQPVWDMLHWGESTPAAVLGEKE